MWTTEFSGTTDAQCLDHWTTTYWIGGDTLIDGTAYTRIENRTAYWQSPILSMYCTTWHEYTGEALFVREVDHRVFHRNTNGEERMIYDFTAEVGDTIPFPSAAYGDDQRGVVIGIDSILVNGTYRKRFTIPEIDGFGFGPPQIIEGIGGNRGPFQELYGQVGLSHGTRLLCVVEHGTSVHGEDPCLLLTGVREPPLAAPVLVFPNPTNGPVHFGVAPVQYLIADAVGRTVARGYGHGVDLSDHPSGAYLLRTWVDPSTLSATVRLIVQR